MNSEIIFPLPLTFFIWTKFSSINYISNGIIQQTFVANYADYTGDLISSHELYIVVKDPEWVVGEKAPKESSIQNIPTPISTELLKKQDRVNEYQERIVDRYNIDDQGAVVEAVNNDPTKIDQDQKNNMDLINSFIKKEKNKWKK